MVARELEHEPVQRLATRSVERREQLVLHLGDDRPQTAELSEPVRRQGDEVAPPVVRVAFALDERALLETVENPDELASVEHQRVRDAGLRLPRLLAEECQDAVVVEAEAGRLDRFDRARLEAIADAREQERRVLQQLLRKPERRSGWGSIRCYLRAHENECSTPTFACGTVDSFNDQEGLQMNGEIVAQAPAVLPDERKKWLGLAVIVAAQFMVVLDVAIVNVALPSIKTDLGFSQESLQWVITAYAIFFGGVLLLGGRLADLLGRRRLFMIGLAIFTVSSLLDR